MAVNKGYIYRKVDKKKWDKPTDGHVSAFTRLGVRPPYHTPHVAMIDLMEILTERGYHLQRVYGYAFNQDVLQVYVQGEPYARCIVRNAFDVLSPFIRPGRGGK